MYWHMSYLDFQKVLWYAIYLVKALSMRLAASGREAGWHAPLLALSLILLALRRVDWAWVHTLHLLSSIFWRSLGQYLMTKVFVGRRCCLVGNCSLAMLRCALWSASGRVFASIV